MPSPFIFIATNRLKAGALDRERERVPHLVEFIEANEPRLIAFNEYVSEAGDEVTVVQVHPDAASMEEHMEILRERVRGAAPKPDKTIRIGAIGETYPDVCMTDFLVESYLSVKAHSVSAPAAATIRGAMTQEMSIWVDFGGVLTPPAAETFAIFCERAGIAPEQMGTAMFAVAQSHGCNDVLAPLDTPLMTTAEWSDEVERALAETFSVTADLSEFERKWFADRPPNAALVDYIRVLREEGYFVGMLSNMVPGFEPYWRQMVEPELFDELVFSYREGVRKPQPAIYELAARRAAAPASACLLIDDLEPNCVAARSAGWHAVQFVDTAHTISEVDSVLGRRQPGREQMSEAG